MGDIALKKVADVIKNTLRDFDICARLGGEEFAVLLPETNQDKAYEAAERLRVAIERSEIALPTSGLMLKMTISIGISTLASKEDNLDMLISRADKALYEAKHAGRNRVSISH